MQGTLLRDHMQFRVSRMIPYFQYASTHSTTYRFGVSAALRVLLDRANRCA